MWMWTLECELSLRGSLDRRSTRMLSACRDYTQANVNCLRSDSANDLLDLVWMTYIDKKWETDRDRDRWIYNYSRYAMIDFIC